MFYLLLFYPANGLINNKIKLLLDQNILRQPVSWHICECLLTKLSLSYKTKYCIYAKVVW